MHVVFVAVTVLLALAKHFPMLFFFKKKIVNFTRYSVREGVTKT